MAVTSFSLVDAWGDGDNQSTRNYHTLWNAVTNDADDHALTVLSSPLMPNRPNSPYSIGNDIDLLAYSHKAKAKRKKAKAHRTLWNVWIDFTTKPSSESNSDSDFSNPLLAPVKFTGEFTDATRQMQVDLNGNEVTNSAGDPLPLEIEAPLFRLQMTKNFATFDIPLWQQYARKATNSDLFWGAAAKTVLCLGIRPTIEFWQGGNAYYPTTFDFLFLDPTDDKPDWELEWLRDVGPRYWTGGQKGQGSRVHFRDDEGSQFVDGQGDLNGFGGALAAGANPQFRIPKVKEVLPFGALGVPTQNPYT